MRSIAGLLWLMLVGCSDPEPPARATETAAEVLPAAPALPATPAAAAPTVVVPAAVAATAPVVRPVLELVMDVMQVVGKSEAEVSILLGAPSSCEDIHRARLCRYPPDDDEVMFVAGKADMITVQAMDAVAFDEHALAALGLAPANPDHADEHGIRWESVAGLEEVTVFPGQGGTVRYAYVKVGRH